MSKHPVNQVFHDNVPLGARIADRVTNFLGSWKFIVIQTILVGFWFALNIYLLRRPFDPFPFVLLNLAFSTQAAYAASLVLLASNRQALKDRATLEHAAAEADKADSQNLQILSEILRIENSILTEVRKIKPGVNKP